VVDADQVELRRRRLLADDLRDGRSVLLLAEVAVAVVDGDRRGRHLARGLRLGEAAEAKVDDRDPCAGAVQADRLPTVGVRRGDALPGDREQKRMRLRTDGGER